MSNIQSNINQLLSMGTRISFGKKLLKETSEIKEAISPVEKEARKIQSAAEASPEFKNALLNLKKARDKELGSRKAVEEGLSRLTNLEGIKAFRDQVFDRPERGEN